MIYFLGGSRILLKLRAYMRISKFQAFGLLSQRIQQVVKWIKSMEFFGNFSFGIF